ncbi:MAG TPA: DUF1801 domain-containing protein [Anaerolineaceae bacterium]|nr:DUF1801 domain-containing protein [Anaerolineaceae bacterium]
MEKPKNITEYIQSAPEAAQQKLWELLEILRKASPDAEESLKWGQPALSYQWILYQFAAFQHHISLYPHPNVVKAFQDRLTEYKTSSSTIQFPLDKPLPVDLIFEIAAYRVQESTENGIKWK